MNKKLPREFYTRPAIKVAKQMLGKFLVHNIRSKQLVGKIVETEAYIGPQDKASHAFNRKKTERNKAEWLIGGHIYIYLVYGIYWQLNITTGKKDFPECVLIRALEPIKGFNKYLSVKEIKNLANGPGKLCRWMGFNKNNYGIDVVNSNKIYLTPGEDISSDNIVAGKRIGIDYAQEWADKPLRFYIKHSEFVSKK